MHEPNMGVQVVNVVKGVEALTEIERAKEVEPWNGMKLPLYSLNPTQHQ